MRAPRLRRGVAPLLLGAAVAACGTTPLPLAPAPPEADAEWPRGLAGFEAAPEEVFDEAAGERRRLLRSPGAEARGRGGYPAGTVLAKVHVDPRNPELVLRVDLRTKAPGGPYDGWTYRSFDPATRQALKIDPEVCYLCHAAAPQDGTYTPF